MTTRETVPYLPVTVHQRPEDSRTNIGFQTFSSANFSTVWGVDHFSAAGVLRTSDERAALSNSIDLVLATGSGFREAAIGDCVRLLTVSLPRNRPIMNRVLDTVPPLQPSCDVTVLAPVASAQEAEAIPAFLESLVGQSLPPENWNALLFLNMADREPGVTPIPDDTERHIEDFKAAHPELQIHVVKVHYSEVQPIGAIRHDAACAALVRHVARFPRGPADHLLVMADADQSKAGPRWLETFHRVSMRDQSSSAFQGHYLWDRYTLGNDPGVLGFTICDFAIRSFFQARFPEEGAAGGGGPNLAVRASKFALCGYNPSLKRGADPFLISALQELAPVKSVGAAARIETSGRRTSIASQHGYSPHEQWNAEETRFSEANDAIRNSVVRTLISEPEFIALMQQPEFSGRFERWISKLVNSSCTLQNPRNRSKDHRGNVVNPYSLVEEVLKEKLGLPASFEPFRNRVSFGNASAVQDWLLAWRRSIIRPLQAE